MSSRANRRASTIAMAETPAMLVTIAWPPVDFRRAAPIGMATMAKTANAVSTPPLTTDDMTFKRPVASQISGAMMATEVAQVNAAANLASGAELAATQSQTSP